MSNLSLTSYAVHEKKTDKYYKHEIVFVDHNEKAKHFFVLLITSVLITYPSNFNEVVSNNFHIYPIND